MKTKVIYECKCRSLSTNNKNMIGSVGTPRKLMHLSQAIIVSVVWDALNTCMATELQQFKFQIDNKSKSFKMCVLIFPLFCLSSFCERVVEVWVWVSSVIVQCFSYFRLLYKSRCCLIPFGKGHICCISKFMNTFRVVYSVKALFAVQLNTLILFDNVKAHLVFS